MIKLNHIRDAAKIHKNFHNGKRIEFERELLIEERLIKKGEKKKHDWKQSRWKKAKKQLTYETCSKCAYCEAPWEHVAYGDVEHYRPKSTYWWLAYCYENYLVSCTLCNQEYKKAIFRVKDTKMVEPDIQADTADGDINSLTGKLTPDPLDQDQVEEFYNLHEQERPLLINPYIDQPEDYFAWEADTIKAEIKLIPNPNNPGANEFCEEAIKYYGLNRKKLKEYRYAQYEHYYTYRSFINDPGASLNNRQRAQNMIKKLKTKKSAYAGMVIYFDSFEFGKLPEPPIV